MQDEIYFFCKKCRKSLGVTYTLTGDDNAPVLPNIMIKCSHNHCKRVMFLKKCRKSVGATYTITGNDDAPVLPNVVIKCSHNHCKRAMFLKNYTEKRLIENAVGDKFYM